MKINDSYEEEIMFSQNDVERFAELSGDHNPIHLNFEFAAKTIFKKPIVHGILVASVFSKILGNIFPGEGTIYGKQSLNFSLPVYVGQKYFVKLIILDIDRFKGSAVIETKILSNIEENVLVGEAIVYNSKFKTSI